MSSNFSFLATLILLGFLLSQVLGCSHSALVSETEVNDRVTAEQLCQARVQAPNVSAATLAALTARLEKLQTTFQTSQQRSLKPDQYVREMNQVIAATDMNFLLKCVQDWEAIPNQKVKIEFGDSHKPQPMKTSTRHEANSAGLQKLLVISLDLHSSVQRILPAYMRELMHVCQEPEKLKLAENGEEDQINRFAFFKEVEAFDLMGRAYRQLSQASPRMCIEETSPAPTAKPTLAEAFQAGEKERRRGTFAQRVITWYWEGLKPFRTGILDETQDSIQYQATDLGPAFQLRPLTPELAERIVSAGLPLTQQASE